MSSSTVMNSSRDRHLPRSPRIYRCCRGVRSVRHVHGGNDRFAVNEVDVVLYGDEFVERPLNKPPHQPGERQTARKQPLRCTQRRIASIEKAQMDLPLIPAAGPVQKSGLAVEKR